MPTENDNSSDHARSTVADARAWEQTPDGREELRRLAAMNDENIDFSDIPELTGGRRSQVERLLDELGDDPAALMDVLDAVSRRLRAATSRRAG